MEATVRPSALAGTARAPPSKSYTHRALLAAGLSDGGTVRTPLDSADTRATARAVEAFGGGVTWSDGAAAVEGVDGAPTAPDEPVDCANSGTTMRLAAAVAALADGTTVLTGDDSLRGRPQGPLLAAIEQLGGRAESADGDGTAPLHVTGPIDGGTATIPGDVSSQFVTGLLLAGAATPAGVEVVLETPLKSAPYVDITREILAAFGVETVETAAEADGDGGGSTGGFGVAGGQRYETPPDGYPVPGDFSSISYLLAAGAVAGGDGVVVEGAHPSAQGDAAIVDHVRRMGAPVDWDREAGTIAVEAAPLSGVRVDVGDTPDLLPTVAALGAVATGVTWIENCEHVRYKETDRVAAMAEELSALGAAVDERPDELVVRGGDSTLVGARVDGRGDHRIAMALAVAGLGAEGETTVDGAEHVDVSFPGFWDVLADLGAAVSTDG